jgi:hypothetical protein
VTQDELRGLGPGETRAGEDDDGEGCGEARHERESIALRGRVARCPHA